MTAVLERRPDLAGLEDAALTRARWLSRLYVVSKAKVESAGGVRATLVRVDVGGLVVARARGCYRNCLVAARGDDELVVEYLTENALAAARAYERGGQLRSPLGVDVVAYATDVATRARQEAEEKLRTWQRWATTSPELLATDESARRVWRHIAPGHGAGAAGSVAPAAAALLARQDAVNHLRTHQRLAWPREEFARAFAQAYVRDRVSRLCRQAPHLAWVKVQRVTVPRRFAFVVDSGTGE